MITASVIRIIGKDPDRVSEAIQRAFIQACEKAGIPFELKTSARSASLRRSATPRRTAPPLTRLARERLSGRFGGEVLLDWRIAR